MYIYDLWLASHHEEEERERERNGETSNFQIPWKAKVLKGRWVIAARGNRCCLLSGWLLITQWHDLCLSWRSLFFTPCISVSSPLLFFSSSFRIEPCYCTMSSASCNIWSNTSWWIRYVSEMTQACRLLTHRFLFSFFFFCLQGSALYGPSYFSLLCW